MDKKINLAYELLNEVARELATNYENDGVKKLDYNEEVTLIEIQNITLDIRALANISKSKKPIEERVKRYAR